MNTKDYVVRLEDLKRPIEENPYDPNTGNIAAYMRYLRYNTPPAQPKRGKWIDRGEHESGGRYWHEWECNKCHHYFDKRTFFCPHCGADMRGEQYG